MKGQNLQQESKPESLGLYMHHPIVARKHSSCEDECRAGQQSVQHRPYTLAVLHAILSESVCMAVSWLGAKQPFVC